MTPERKEKIGPHILEEYYWAGKIVVYIDNSLTDETFNVARMRLKLEKAKPCTKEEPRNIDDYGSRAPLTRGNG